MVSKERSLKRIKNLNILLSAGLFFLLVIWTSFGSGTPEAYARRPPYSVTPIGIQALGINASGQVVGMLGNDHAFLWTPDQPNGTTGTLADLGTLGGTSSDAKGVNTSGEVAGYSTLSDGSYNAMLDSQGSMIDIGTLGGNYSTASGINATGQVVGQSYMEPQNTYHAFLWTPTVPNGTTGTMTDLGALGSEGSTAFAVNSSAQVVGYTYISTGAFRAFLWQNGTMSDLGTLGGDYSQADAINDSGQIVGQAYLAGNADAHAFLWQNGTMQDLGDLGSHYSTGYGITSNGQQIVGSADVPNPSGFLVYHAFIYGKGRMRDLNRLIPAGTGWVLTSATGINDAGQIVGYGTLNGQPTGFLLTP